MYRLNKSHFYISFNTSADSEKPTERKVILNKKDIIQLFIDKIPENHILNDHVHVLRRFVISKSVHPFIEWMAEALAYIDNLIPGYAQRIVNWISTLVNKNEYEQNFAVFGEILVMLNVAKLADRIEEKQYIESEPTSVRESKNPEFRSSIEGIYYAGEVKTPSLAKYIYGRQEGIQITTHLPDRNLLLGEKIVNPNTLKILDNLKNTQEKYIEYTKSDAYKEDYRFLFIVWDDFVNEPISALTNPYCGLFTENTFYPNSNFDLIDGVFIIRHLHQFHRMLRNEELMYEYNHAFEWNSPYTPIAFIQNPNGRKVPDVFIRKYNAIDPIDMYSAEYRPTDWVDWRTGIAISGLNSIPQKYHKRISEIIIKSTETHLERSLTESANFGVLNLDKFVETNKFPDGSTDYETLLIELKDAIEMAKELQETVEREEKEYQEEQAEKIHQAQIRTIKQAMGDLDIKIKPRVNKVKRSTPIKKTIDIGRNEKCYCGSGMKFKKCCINLL